MMGGYWGFGGWWMIIVWLVVAGLIIWGIVAFARRGGTSSSGGAGQTPLDIAKQRYARGEISKEEYERLKKDLS